MSDYMRTELHQCEQPGTFGTAKLVWYGPVGDCSHVTFLPYHTVPYRAVLNLRAGVNGV